VVLILDCADFALAWELAFGKELQSKYV